MYCDEITEQGAIGGANSIFVSGMKERATKFTLIELFYFLPSHVDLELIYFYRKRCFINKLTQFWLRTLNVDLSQCLVKLYLFFIQTFNLERTTC